MRVYRTNHRAKERSTCAILDSFGSKLKIFLTSNVYFFFSWTEASLKTRKLNRTKPLSTHLSLKKGTKTLNDRSSCQTSSSFIAPRLYHYSCNSCMTLICITVAITTTTECLFEGLFKLRIHYPIDDWICKTTGEQQIHR